MLRRFTKSVSITLFSFATCLHAEDLCELKSRHSTASAEEIAAADQLWAEGTRLLDLKAIPKADRAPGFLNQNTILRGGEFIPWDGPFDYISSPQVLRTPDGTVRRFVLGRSPNMDAESAYLSYEAARKGWNHGAGEWPSATMEQRADRMRLFVTRMREQREVLIRWVMWEIGKPRDLAEMEIDRTIAYIEDTIVEALKLTEEGRALRSIGKNTFLIDREPLGVVPIFAPYNYPLNETFTNLIPALMMGNTVVIKPARWGILLLSPLLKAFQECFPAGVVNFVYGSDGRALLEKIQKEGGYEGLGFIGGERAASGIIHGNTRPNRTKVTLGLGAKNMAVILNDADLESTVKANLDGCLTYSGQRCTAHKIVFVQRQVAPAFLSAMAKSMDELKIGPTWLPGVKITASPDTGWVDLMDSLVTEGVSKGATIYNLLGGRKQNGFYSPTLLVNVTPDMEVYHREQFGPVVPVVIFDDIEETVAWQVQSRYGQQVALFGSDPVTLKALTNRFKRMVGRVNINSACRRSPDGVPFGARADSGLGTLSLRDALLAYSTDSVVDELPMGNGAKVLK